MPLLNCLLRYFLAIGIILLLNINCNHATKRHIECKYIHEGENKPFNFIRVSAERDEDTVHYLWSSYKLPSVVVARTTNDTDLHVDYEKLGKFQTGAIQFSKEPLAFTGLTISELWELSYQDDTSGIDDALSVTGLGLEFFDWSNSTNATSCSVFSASVKFIISGEREEPLSKKGEFQVQFSVSGDEGQDSEFPHLIYSGNSTQVKITLDKLSSNSSRTRYGLKLKLFSTSSKSCFDADIDKNCMIDVVDSISDEFSPGVFSDIDVYLPCSQPDPENGTFLTWRPVAYTSTKPSVASSSDVKFSPQCPNVSITAPRSIAELYFKDQTNNLANVFNITFGTVGDGFYGKTKYTAWYVMIGTGNSVHPTLSTTALVIMSIGTGAVVLFFMSGGIFSIVKRCRRKNDDLLLSENCVN